MWRVKIHPPSVGGESSEITSFTVYFGICSPVLGVKSSPPPNWGIWIFRVGGCPHSSQSNEKNPSSVGGGLPNEGVDAKKFGTCHETQAKQTCFVGCPGILAVISRRCPKSLRKSLCSIFGPYNRSPRFGVSRRGHPDLF